MSVRSFINAYHVAISVSILSILYVVGIVRLVFFKEDSLIMVTPLLLLINFFFLYIYTYEKRSWKLFSFCLLFLLGLGIEILGVNTGFPFGEYQYGDVLGAKIFNTPWIIGINWVIVIVSSFQFISRILPLAKLIVKAICTAFVALALDLLIEPIAVEYGMWTWEHDHIPISNYFAWGIISLIFSYLYGIISEQRTHLVVIIILFWLFIFFGVLNLSL